MNINFDRKKLKSKHEAEFLVSNIVSVGLNILFPLQAIPLTFSKIFRQVGVYQKEEQLLLMQLLQNEISDTDKTELVAMFRKSFPISIQIQQPVEVKRFGKVVMKNGKPLVKHTPVRFTMKSPEQLVELCGYALDETNTIETSSKSEKYSSTLQLTPETVEQIIESSLRELRKSAHYNIQTLAYIFVMLFASSTLFAKWDYLAVPQLNEALNTPILPKLEIEPTKLSAKLYKERISTKEALFDPISKTASQLVQPIINQIHSPLSTNAQNTTPFTADSAEQPTTPEVILEGKPSDIKKMSPYFSKGLPLQFRHDKERGLSFQPIHIDSDKKVSTQYHKQRLSKSDFVPKIETNSTKEELKESIASTFIAPLPKHGKYLSLTQENSGYSVVIPVTISGFKNELLAHSIRFVDPKLPTMLDISQGRFDDKGNMVYPVKSQFIDTIHEYLGSAKPLQIEHQNNAPFLSSEYDNTTNTIKIKGVNLQAYKPDTFGKYLIADLINQYTITDGWYNSKQTGYIFESSIIATNSISAAQLKELFAYITSKQFISDGGLMYKNSINYPSYMAILEDIGELAEQSFSLPASPKVSYKVSSALSTSLDLPRSLSHLQRLKNLKGESDGIQNFESTQVPMGYEGQMIFDIDYAASALDQIQLPETSQQVRDVINAIINTSEKPQFIAQMNHWSKRLNTASARQVSMTSEQLAIIKEVTDYVKNQFDYGKNEELNSNLDGKNTEIQLSEIVQITGNKEKISCFTANFLSSSMLTALGIQNQVFQGYYNDGDLNSLSTNENHAWVVVQVGTGDTKKVLISDSTPERKPVLSELSDPSELIEFVVNHTKEAVIGGGLLVILGGILWKNKLILEAYLAKNNPEKASKLLYTALVQLPETDQQLAINYLGYVKYGGIDSKFNKATKTTYTTERKGEVTSEFVRTCLTNKEFSQKVQNLNVHEMPQEVCKFIRIVQILI